MTGRDSAAIGSTGLFLALLDRCVADASIGCPAGADVRIAGRRTMPPAVTVDVRDERVFQRALALGNLGLGEAYMDGDLALEQGTLAESADGAAQEPPRRTAPLASPSGVAGAGASVAQPAPAHSTRTCGATTIRERISSRAFLDRTMTYSCGYARTPQDSAEDLQQNKFDRICRKLRLEPGQTLLDIGCGFGGLLIHAAPPFTASQGVGITNSQVACEASADERRPRRGGPGAWRSASGTSAASGNRSIGSSASACSSTCRAGCYAAIFTVWQRRSREAASAWCTRSVATRRATTTIPSSRPTSFPGSNQPRLSEIARHLEANRLLTLDVENIVRHYGFTVSRWLERFHRTPGASIPSSTTPGSGGCGNTIYRAASRPLRCPTRPFIKSCSPTTRPSKCRLPVSDEVRSRGAALTALRRELTTRGFGRKANGPRRHRAGGARRFSRSAAWSCSSPATNLAAQGRRAADLDGRLDRRRHQHPHLVALRDERTTLGQRGADVLRVSLLPRAVGHVLVEQARRRPSSRRPM